MSKRQFIRTQKSSPSDVVSVDSSTPISTFAELGLIGVVVVLLIREGIKQFRKQSIDQSDRFTNVLTTLTAELTSNGERIEKLTGQFIQTQRTASESMVGVQQEMSKSLVLLTQNLESQQNTLQSSIEAQNNQSEKIAELNEAILAALARGENIQNQVLESVADVVAQIDKARTDVVTYVGSRRGWFS